MGRRKLSEAERLSTWRKQNPGGDARIASKNLSIPIHVVRQFFDSGNVEYRTKPESFGKTLSEFRSVYDKDYIVPKQIRAGLKKLGSTWEYEVEFARQIGVRIADLANYREMFTEHVVTLTQASKRVWAGTTALAKQLREMV